MTCGINIASNYSYDLGYHFKAIIVLNVLTKALELPQKVEFLLDLPLETNTWSQFFGKKSWFAF